MSEQKLRLTAAQVDLMGNAEIAKLLGVSRNRVVELASTHKAFPPPLARLSMGPVYCGVAIREFLASWDRRPGRPPLKRTVKIKDDDDPR